MIGVGTRGPVAFRRHAVWRIRQSLRNVPGSSAAVINSDMAAIPVTRSISIDDSELVESTTRSGGRGGQHVNTTDSAVILRFDIVASPSLPEAVKYRLAMLAGARLTREGVIVLRSEGSRSQLLNREEVRARLIAMIREAVIVPKTARIAMIGMMSSMVIVPLNPFGRA